LGQAINKQLSVTFLILAVLPSRMGDPSLHYDILILMDQLQSSITKQLDVSKLSGWQYLRVFLTK